MASITPDAPSDNTPQRRVEALEVEVKLAVDEHTGVPDLTQLTGVASILHTTEHNLSAIYYDLSLIHI